MPRRTVGKAKRFVEAYDYDPLISPGITMLKFGALGNPHERLFRLSQDHRFLSWHAGILGPKIGSNCVVDLEKVSRIMQGQNTFQFQRFAHLFGDASEKSLSIVYLDKNNQEKTLNLIAPSADVFKLFFGGIRALVKKLQDQRQNYSKDSLFLKSLWDRADADHSGTLTFKEISQLVASININLPNDKIKQIYKKYDVDGNGTLDFSEFIDFMAHLRRRIDLEAIWTMVVEGQSLADPMAQLNIEDDFKYADSTISVDQFINFYAEASREELTPDDALELLEYCNVSATAHTGTRHQADRSTIYDLNLEITFTMFANVLKNLVKTNLLDPTRSVEYQDMNRPLSHYYMASSHNTYLEGDQLTSFSSVNRYVDDLLSGCRCVELDCWDGDNGQPIISHGHTITGKILFKDVIRAISEYGFVNSPYPIVLSIENHCSLEQQKVLARIMREILKDMLALPLKSGEFAFLPSPSDLTRKVLVKGKRVNDASIEEDEEDEEEDEESEEWVMKQKDAAVAIEKMKAGANMKRDGTARALNAEKTEVKLDPKKKAHAPKIHPDLSNVVYLGTGKVKNFSPEVSRAIPSDMMASYGETKTNKLVKDTKKVRGWIEHNKTHLSRIYPKGTRIDSSNYLPTAAWAAGNQLVALNYQTGDLPYHINHGKFLENGRSGYVLKPEYMIDDSVKMPDSTDEGYRLILNIISGSYLPKPGGAQKGEIIDPFVVVYLNGPNMSEFVEVKTKTIQDNGFNPVWNQTFTFDIKRPELNYLTFYVNDEDVLSHEFIAFVSLPVSCIREGFRTIQLYNIMGKRDQDFEYASLFVRATFEPIGGSTKISSP